MQIRHKSINSKWHDIVTEAFGQKYLDIGFSPYWRVLTWDMYQLRNLRQLFHHLVHESQGIKLKYIKDVPNIEHDKQFIVLQVLHIIKIETNKAYSTQDSPIY